MVGAEAGAAPATAQTASGSCPTSFSNLTPVVGIAPATGGGYWEVDQSGTVAAVGGAACYGSAPSALNQPIVGMASTPDGGGYWLVAADGGVFAFGDAHFYGSTGNIRLDQPVTGIAPTPDGHGYFLVARDGGIFSYGDAGFHGSMGGQHLQAPVVGAAVDPQTGGYWLLGADGGVFSFDAPFHGSPATKALPAPATAISVTAGGAGYRIVTANGNVHAYPIAAYSGEASVPAGTMRCLSNQVAAAVVGGQAGVGNVAAAISFTNRSSSTCSLSGYPGVGLVSSNDAILPVATDRGQDYLFADPGPTDQVLAPGASSYFDVGYTDMPMGQPSSSLLEVNVPNGTNPMFVPMPGIVRAYTGPNHINVNAVHPAPAFSVTGG